MQWIVSGFVVLAAALGGWWWLAQPMTSAPTLPVADTSGTPATSTPSVVDAPASSTPKTTTTPKASTSSGSTSSGGSTSSTGSATAGGTTGTGSTPAQQPQQPQQPTTPAGPKKFTMAEVAAHSSGSSCYTVVDGSVYDLTQWIPQHPGGMQAILGLCGRDGSATFHGQHGNAQEQATILATFKIGVLAQ